MCLRVNLLGVNSDPHLKVTEGHFLTKNKTKLLSLSTNSRASGKSTGSFTVNKTFMELHSKSQTTEVDLS